MPGGTSPTPARFSGFPDPRARFFHTLAKRQSREWFAMHRDEYEQGWVAPMKLLLGELREKLDPLFEQHALGEPKVFRIHRDVRFSKDKSPFKTHIAGYVPLHGGGSGAGQPVPVYVQLGTETFVGGGHYMMDPGQLARYRAAVLDDARGAALANILATAAKAGYGLVAHEASLKKVPRGVDPAHPRAELLKRKGLAVEFPTPPTTTIGSRAFVGWLVNATKKIVPLIEWLAEETA